MRLSAWLQTPIGPRPAKPLSAAETDARLQLDFEGVVDARDACVPFTKSYRCLLDRRCAERRPPPDIARTEPSRALARYHVIVAALRARDHESGRRSRCRISTPKRRLALRSRACDVLWRCNTGKVQIGDRRPISASAKPSGAHCRHGPLSPAGRPSGHALGAGDPVGLVRGTRAAHAPRPAAEAPGRSDRKSCN